MRATDREEVTFNAMATGRAGKGWTVEAEIRNSFNPQTFWAMTLKGHLMAVGGVASIPGTQAGAIWLLGTDLADREWRALTRGTAAFIAMARKRWGWVGNVVPQHMAARQRWLQHLGFDMIENQAQLASIGLVAFCVAGPDGPDA